MTVVTHYYQEAIDRSLLCQGSSFWVEPFTVNVILLDNTYTPDLVTHYRPTHLSGELALAGGYSRKEVTGRTQTLSGGVWHYDGDDVTWTAATFTARYAVVYADFASDSFSELYCLVDFGADVSPVAEDFVITWDAAGVFTLTVN